MSSRASATGGTLAASVLLVLVALDVIVTDASIALSPLFSLAALAACAVLPARQTAVVAGVAAVAAVLSGTWNDSWGTVQHAVRVVNVVLVGAASVVVAAVRVRREQEVGRLTTVAEVAQRAVLPILPAHARRTDIAVRYRSASQDTVIGGDLYDCYHSRSHTRFLIGDVRGKGLGAIEQAARVIRAFRQAAAIQGDLGAVAEDMSDYLVPFFDEEEFVTAHLLDTTDPGRPLLVDAGHPPPLLVHPDGSCELVEQEADLPLGIGQQYTARAFTWRPGDRLLLYTDGLSEARDDDGEFFDVLTLGPLLTGSPVDEALDHVLDAVRRHATGDGLGDDLAVILLEHTEGGDDYLPLAGEHDWRSSLQR